MLIWRIWGVVCLVVLKFVCIEGIIFVFEFMYVIVVIIWEVLVCKESGEVKVIVIVFCGYGYFDLVLYDIFFVGGMYYMKLGWNDCDCRVLWLWF